MRTILFALYDNPKYSKLFEWGKLLTITGGAQLTIQVIGLVCGILVIRLLPTQEYAYYTIANSMLGIMTLLSDGGIVAGIMAESGKVWQDKKELSKIVITGLNLRIKFAILSILFTVPLLYYTLNHHGASGATCVLVILAIIPNFLSTLSGSILEIILKLYQNIVTLQRIQVKSNIGRLILIGSGTWLLPVSYVSIFVNSLSQLWLNYNLRKSINNYIDWKQKTDIKYRKQLLKMVGKILPGAIYYSFSSQITLWLVSIFGNTSTIAQIGALGRLTMIMSIISVIFNTLIIPRFSRLEPIKSVLRNNFFKVQIVTLVLGIFFATFSIFFSNQLLQVLGSKYQGLNKELIISMLGGFLGLASGINFSLCISRGWVINSLITSTISIITIVLCVQLMDASTLIGVLTLNLLVNLTQYILWTLFGLSKLNTLN